MNNKHHIKGFDALRAVSILMVLITHLGLYRFFKNNKFMADRVWPLLSGLTGVQFFFCISGFLITLLLLKEKSRNGSINFLNFYARRFIRLLPALIIFYVLYLFLCFAGCLPYQWRGILFSFFYVYNFIPNWFYSGELGHMWSLSVEEQFYLVWPFILSMAAGIRKQFILMSIVLIASISSLIFLPSINFEYNGHHYVLGDLFQTERWFIPAVAPVIIGSFAAIWVMNRKQNSNIFSVQPFLSLLFACILYISPVWLPENLLSSRSIFQSVGVVFFLLLIYYHQNAAIVNKLQWKPLVYLGKISYGLYVFQGLFLTTGPGSTVWFQQFPVNIIFAVSMAVLSFEFIEKKALRLKLRYGSLNT